MTTSQSRAIREYLIKIGAYIRMQLRLQWNIERGEYEDYRGLCDQASEMVAEEIKKGYNTYQDRYGPLTCVQMLGPYHAPCIHHGEIAHTSRYPSQYWGIEHTYVIYEVRGIEFYVDLTCQQFQWLDPSIPDYYIGTKPPFWLYEDRKNPRWKDHGWYGFWNRIHLVHGKKRKRDSVIEFLQYEVWGKLCDWKRRIARKRDPIPPWEK